MPFCTGAVFGGAYVQPQVGTCQCCADGDSIALMVVRTTLILSVHCVSNHHRDPDQALWLTADERIMNSRSLLTSGGSLCSVCACV